MANRSYLYSIDVEPPSSEGARKVVPISEWNYDVPLVYKLLLSGNPRGCKSLIFDAPENIAVFANYNAGVERLRSFLMQIESPEAQPLVREALEFLGRNEKRQRYFLLEPGELFDLYPEPPEEQNQMLLEAIKDVGRDADKALASLKGSGLFGRIVTLLSNRSESEHLLNRFYKLGLGNWCNCLYYTID